MVGYLVEMMVLRMVDRRVYSWDDVMAAKLDGLMVASLEQLTDDLKVEMMDVTKVVMKVDSSALNSVYKLVEKKVWLQVLN